jgi:hypothetical protein
MKWFLFSLFLFSIHFSFGQKAKDTTKFITVSPGLKVERDDDIKTYADSINNYTEGKDIPNFLFEKCFELDNMLRKSFHPSSSVRWEVLLRVSNKCALKTIMQKFSVKLKRKCSDERILANKVSTPTANQSFYELMRKRYIQLQHPHN